MSDPGARMTGFPQQQQQLMQPVFLPAGATGRQPLPKQLTAAIKGCSSLERLAQLFHAHQSVLNPIHIAAMITKLPKLDTSIHNAAAAGADLPWILSTASAQQVQLLQLLQQLLLRLKAQGCNEYGPRGVANIIWALAKLQCAPDPDLRHMLLDKFCSELALAVPQDISNVLWGVAKLTKERTSVVTNNAPTLNSAPGGMQTASLAGGSFSSHSTTSSPSLGGSGLNMQEWALSAVAPSGQADPSPTAAVTPLLAQEQVRLLLQHLCQQLHAASVQTISNSLWAVVVLQQEHQWCMCNCLAEVQALLSVFCKQPQQALPGHIQPVIRCMAQLASTCSNHAGDSWIKWQPPLLRQLLDYLCSQRDHMEMHHVSSVLRDVAQVVCLHLLLAKQVRDAKQQQHLRTSRTGSIGEACLPGLEQDSSSPQQAAPDPVGSGSTANSRGLAVPSLNTISAKEEAEDVLARLAATGGPQDASSTVVALAMLRPQLDQLSLQQGVAGLCSLLPAAALPQLAEEVGQRLLAAASSHSPASSMAAAAAVSNHLRVALPEQQKQQQVGPPPQAVVATPTARPGSSSAGNSSSSNVDHASAAAAVAGTGPGSTVVIISNPTLPPAGGSPTAASDTAGDSSSLGNLLTGPAAAEAGLPPPAAAGDSGTASSLATGSGLHALEGPVGQSLVVASQLINSTVGSGGHADIRAGGSAAEVVEDVGGTSSAADSQEEAAARQLTHNIAYADSVYQLAEIFDAHGSVMDMIHITACITRLGKVLGSAPSASAQAAAAALLPLLGGKLLQVLPNANARGIANVLWGYGRIKNLPQSDLVARLVEAFLLQLPTAACRDSAVVLWSLARLTEAQGMTHLGIQTGLLQQLGTAVIEQLSAAAEAAPQQQSPAPQQPPQPVPTLQIDRALSRISSNRSDASAAGPEGSGETSHGLSSRDVSNSLMALTRLGFTPEPPQEPAAAVAAAGEAHARASSALAAQLDVLSLGAAAPAAPGAGSEQQDTAAAASSEQPAATGPVHLTLPIKPIQMIVRFLLQHVATAKTLDLQEAATALKQLGLIDLHNQVTAAILSPGSGSGSGHGHLHPSGSHHGHAPAGLQYMHQLAAGGSSGSGSPLLGRFGPSEPSSQGVVSGRQAARSPGSSSAVSMPGAINLSGTQLAGLLQQQRRQQPLMVSGPAYGAGWLGPAAGPQQQQQQHQRPGQGLGAMASSAGHQQQQQRMSGGSSSRPGGSGAASMMLRSGAGMQGSGTARASHDGVVGGSGYRGVAAGQPGHGITSGTQAQGLRLDTAANFYQQQQQQLQVQPGHQYQQQQTRSMTVQQQGPGGSVQYMFVPQQGQQGSFMLQQSLQTQQQQQQQQQDMLGMQLLHHHQQQQAQIQQQQQQQPTQGQLYMMPTSMASYFGLGSHHTAVAGGGGGGSGGTAAQQQAAFTAAGGLATAAGSGDAWMPQGAVPMTSSGLLQQQQQQQQQQTLQVLPQLQGHFAAGGVGAPAAYQSSSGLLLSPEYVRLDAGAAGMGQAMYSASSYEQQQQQQMQLYALAANNSGTLPQFAPQQGMGRQEPPGLYLQQEQQPMDPMQQQQQQQLSCVYPGGLVLDASTGYIQGGQFQ